MPAVKESTKRKRESIEYARNFNQDDPVKELKASLKQKDNALKTAKVEIAKLQTRIRRLESTSVHSYPPDPVTSTEVLLQKEVTSLKDQLYRLKNFSTMEKGIYTPRIRQFFRHLLQEDISERVASRILLLAGDLFEITISDIPSHTTISNFALEAIPESDRRYISTSVKNSYIWKTW
ncbi:MAG TPA: hypothetical protein VHA52_08525 [Candidatus Babeliaceae bacterium]|nr:hypothetical protein [Candidatus Babeliaceae bacterium]